MEIDKIIKIKEEELERLKKIKNLQCFVDALEQARISIKTEDVCGAFMSYATDKSEEFKFSFSELLEINKKIIDGFMDGFIEAVKLKIKKYD